MFITISWSDPLSTPTIILMKYFAFTLVYNLCTFFNYWFGVVTPQNLLESFMLYYKDCWYVWWYVCWYVCWYICWYVCWYVCGYVWWYVWYVSAYMYADTYADMYADMYDDTYQHICMLIRMMHLRNNLLAKHICFQFNNEKFPDF